MCCVVLCLRDLSCMKVSRKVDLVYGAGRIGLMGCVSQAVQDGGAGVLG